MTYFFLHSVTFQDSFDSMAEPYLVKQISKYKLSTFFFKKIHYNASLPSAYVVFVTLSLMSV